MIIEVKVSNMGAFTSIAPTNIAIRAAITYLLELQAGIEDGSIDPNAH